MGRITPTTLRKGGKVTILRGILRNLENRQEGVLSAAASGNLWPFARTEIVFKDGLMKPERGSVYWR